MDGTALIEVEILGVSEKQVTRKSDGQSMTMYDIQVTDGTQAGSAVYSTSFVDQANEAFKLLNKWAKLSVKVEQNGRWINRYLQRVISEVDQPHPQQEGNGGFLGGSSVPASSVTSHTAKALAETFAQPSQTPDTVTADVISQANAFEDEKQTQIHRQTACKVAAMLFVAGDSQVDFWDNVDACIRFFDTGVKPLAVEIARDGR